MDFIVEIFFEFLIMGTVNIAKNKVAPKFLRLMVLVIIFGTMMLLFYLSYVMRTDVIMMWTFIAIGTIIAIFLIKLSNEVVTLRKK